MSSVDQREPKITPLPDAPRRFHRRLPGYAPTPLLEMPQVAERVGVRRVLVKDESDRFGLPSFKIMGASWAAYRALQQRVGFADDAWRTVAELRDIVHGAQVAGLVTATDGNHGRAVAWIARQLGLRATVFVPAGIGDARAATIGDEGARVVKLEQDYDQVVAAAAASTADDELLISDTSWQGYREIPRWVVDGYGTIFKEMTEQLAPRLPAWRPTLYMVQIGVGSLASALIRHVRTAFPEGSVVGVEPPDAACVLRSLEAGHMVTVPGPHRSIMVGLNCGTPSLDAWPLLRAHLAGVVAVADERAREATRILAESGVESGVSGAAGFAGLLELGATGGGPRKLHADDVVVLLNTEGPMASPLREARGEDN